jgi:hypothetical protein
MDYTTKYQPHEEKTEEIKIYHVSLERDLLFADMAKGDGWK